jgi:two-component system phosphate regulon sensor histidine kinase PhoR
MATRTDDVIGFTRIFVLFVTLVLLPALFMSGFGVIAILNVQKADQQRRRERAEVVLRQAEQRFVAALDAGDRALRAGLEAGAPAAAVVDAARTSGAPIAAWAVVSPAGVVVDGVPPLTTTLADEVTSSSLVAGLQKPAHVVVDDAAFSGVISMQRLADARAMVYAIDTAVLQAAVRSNGDNDEMRVVLRVDQPATAPITNALERVVPEAANDGVDELVGRRLDAPFTRFTIAVEALPSSRSDIVVVVYIVLLAVFLATLITGVVITARLIYQETRLSRLKTDFVSHMSHELRTPLTSIRLFIETLKLGRTSSKEEEQECLELLANETERLSEMIERVLGYARLRAGRRLFRQADVTLPEIIQDAIDAFRAQTLAHASTTGTTPPTLAFTTEVASNLPSVFVDRESLVEALLNLISNAWKYTGVDKRIVVFARPGRRGRIVVGVRDNGPGLPKSEHARIFERFYQAKHLLSGKQPGSGLGLAITKALIEGQGGRITVDSEPGKGSTFAIELKPTPKAARRPSSSDNAPQAAA